MRCWGGTGIELTATCSGVLFAKALSFEPKGSQVINNYVAPDPRTTESGKRDALVNWLAPRDYTKEYPGFSDKAAQGTGRWFLESEPYASWRRRETRHLWCSGKRMSTDHQMMGRRRLET